MTTASNTENKGRFQMVKRIALAGLLLAALAAAPAVGAQNSPVPVPSNLKVPAGNVLLFKSLATGSQIYTCSARTEDPSTFAWTFKAPKAELRNDLGEKVATHYAGPTWQGNDGSTVVGEVVARDAAAYPNAIPWLLLRSKSHGGAGAFSTVTYIQRLATVGGVAPTDGCDQSTAGTERAVPYTATYAFYYGA